MSVLGIGVDLVECERIQHSIDRFGDRFLHRIFTDGEIEYFQVTLKVGFRMEDPKT